MRMLNTRTIFFSSCFYLAGIFSSTAQDNSNPVIENPNIGNFTPITFTTIPEGTVTINQDPRIKTLLNLKAKMERDGNFSDRYKIQLYNGNLNRANEVLKEAEEHFPQWDVTIKWETPNYKVWIGNYRSKLEKDKALREIRKEFPNAFPFIPE